MARQLSDGSIVPTQYDVQTSSSQPANSFSNDVLRVGEVQEIIYPTDPRSMSKLVIEYRVTVQHEDTRSGAGASRDYLNCYAVNLFGGLADKLTFTYRFDNSQNRQNAQGRALASAGLGSKVLVLCINGNHRNAIIIGGVRDKTDTFDKDNNPSTDPQSTQNLGHHLHFVFNGLDCNINRDGELIVTMKGATKIDGTAADSVQTSLVGTKVQMLKDGRFQVDTVNGEESLILDPHNHLIELHTANSEQYFRLDHQNHKTLLQAKNELDITVTDGRCKIQSRGVDVGAATDAWMLGTTYRNAESQMNNKLNAYLQVLQQLVMQAATQLNTAGGAMVVPVSGAVAAAPSVTAAAVALQAAAQIISQMASAIQSFEQNASQYLSQHNKND